MRRDISRINDYFEVTVPRYQHDVFRSHFHMTRRTFELLVHMIGPSEHISKGNSFGRPVLDPRKQIAMSLWMMANQETQRQIADRFDLSLSSVSRCFCRVCKALVDLLPDLVKWSNGSFQRSVEIQDGFEKISGFPRVINAVDGCHIRGRTTSKHLEDNGHLTTSQSSQHKAFRNK
ncbi:PREDICTED: uncharacterized protein LOC107357926 [Acropora digitifera]|uniref:uncharacterized protein LOC107357926 n=1 Tax=Acropora digitifera TaxID=70779 RepID=UPI00077A8E7E|nr:PREDICTED: uncharacterized protein LOC107357926 [Acropora digitifera]